MLGLCTTLEIVGGLMRIFGGKIKCIKYTGAVLGTIGGAGCIMWALGDMYNYFHERREES
jgi:hypothetical protein